MKGWYGDKQAHSLASKGIKIGKKWYNKVDYYEANPDLVFFDFWKANIENDYSNFNFEVAYEMFRPVIEDKLAQFGQRGFERWYEQMNDLSIEFMIEELENEGIEVDGDFGEDFERQIYKFYEKDRIGYDITQKYVDEWNEILKLIDNPSQKELDKIILMDRIMHMTHEAGDLFDLEYLREEFDNWYKPKPEISEIQKARLGIGEFK